MITGIVGANMDYEYTPTGIRYPRSVGGSVALTIALP
jgi:hypothetical protein